ncbi:MAG: hypothetical protein Q7K43_05230, partial [Candidatus Woesearchaeota archaeon]|nr:hypothetical protein [Candidatus Woesearchaeota archaeon]
YVSGGMIPHKSYFAFIVDFHKRRSKKGIKVKLLYSEPAKIIAEQVKALPGTQIKFVSNQFPFSCFVVMYKTKTLITVASEDDLTLFQIDNKSITESFIAQFKILWDQEVKTIRGIEGIKEIFRQTLKCSETKFIGGRGYIAKRAHDFFYDEYVPEAIKCGHKWKNLMLPGGEQVATLPFIESKLLSAEYSTPHVIFIYGDTVANVLWEKEPIAYVIQDTRIAKSYEEYFTMLWNQETSTLKGFEGIKALCNEVLTTNKYLYKLGVNGVLHDRYNAYFFEFEKKRISRGINLFNLSLERTRGKPINLRPNTKVRYLPKEFDSPLVIWIFGDTVANILWDTELIHIIRNKKIANDYRKYFDLLWKNASP